ncbi:MAG: iron ABC transporter substrate-binding protein [Desertimonas sp.]
MHTPRLARRTLLAAALVVGAGGAVGASAAAGSDDDAPDDATGTLTIYSGRGEDLVGPIIEQFEQTSGIDVEVRYGNSAEMLLLIQEEGDNSPADVYYSQGAGFLGVLSDEGGLMELPTELVDTVPEGLRSPAGDWVGLSGRARVLAYNTDELSEADLPASIMDLADPEWAGRIGWAPTNASLQDFVTALRSIVGDDEAQAWVEAMADNAVPFEGNTAIIEAIAAGDVEVGLVNHYYLYRYLAEDPDFPVANHFFEPGDPGTLVNIAGAGVLATSDQPDAAIELLTFLLSSDAQTYFAEETYEIPVVDGVETASELPTIDSLSLPDFDLNLLADLQGTVDLMTDAGAL